MKELIGHIETLLLTNDCVIVPDFGGFIAFNVPAKWVEDGSFFVPPVRTVGFNPQLKLNDGLVVQAYMGAYGTTFPDASKRVKKAARTLKNSLMTDGKIELKGLGTLRVAMDGTYHFVPFIDGLNSPMLYGLGELHIVPLLLAAATTEQVASRPLRITRDTQIVKEEFVLATPDHELEYEGAAEEVATSGRGFLRIAVASAAAVAFFFLLSVPVKNAGPEAYQARLVSSGLFEGKTVVKPVTPPIKGVKEVSEVSTENTPLLDQSSKATKEILAVSALPLLPASSEEQKSASVQKPAPSQKVAAPAQQADRYFIIVGALMRKESAESMVANLQKEGYKKAVLMSGPKVHKISITSFSNEEEAVHALRKFRAGKYEDAWMFKKKV